MPAGIIAALLTLQCTTHKMIKFFFNRFSRMVAIMEALGIVLICAAFILSEKGALAVVLLALIAALYAFIRYCAVKRWYRGVPRYFGIELQFKKALVPASYILAITGVCLLFFSGIFFLSVATFLLAVVAHVNVILICFHRRDADGLPPNFFSSGAFLRNDASLYAS